MATQLLGDLVALSKEAGRRHADVREASDKAHALLKADPAAALASTADWNNIDETPPLYLPIFISGATKNGKIIALAVSALQRLIASGAIPSTLVPKVLETLESVLPQGVEIQLKVLQTLVSLLTNAGMGPPLPGDGKGKRKERLVQDENLGKALELSHRLTTSKTSVVASTASATLRQMFMFVFESVGEEDSTPSTSAAAEQKLFKVDVPPPEYDAASSTPAAAQDEGPRSVELRPAARDAYLLLEDLCLLISGGGEGGGPDGEPSFLRGWTGLSRTFGLELVESIISGFASVVRSHPELLLVLRAHLCPLLIRFLSSPTSSSTTSQFSFPLILRVTRVIFLLLKQFSDLLPLEAEVFLSMFIRVISPSSSSASNNDEGGHPAGSGEKGQGSPAWMRVLVLEIFRGLCADFVLMSKFYERYDALRQEGGSGGGKATVFADLMAAFNRLATEKPAVLGQGLAIMYGSSLGPTSVLPAGAGGSTTNLASPGGTAAGASGVLIEGVVNLAQAAGQAMGSTAAAAAAASGGLSAGTASMKLQCIDQLDKAEPPPIPETYLFLLALQCLASLADGFAAFTLSAYSVINAHRGGDGKAPGSLEWDKLDPTEVRTTTLRTVKEMAETSWPALLASLSFFIATNLDDDLFSDVVEALQNFTSVCGVLGLNTPREAFLTSLCRFAMPASVVAHMATVDSTGQSTMNRSTASSVLTAGVDSLGFGAGAAAPNPIGLSSRNLICLRALISVGQYLAGSLHTSWFAIFETLQNADFVIRINSARGKRRPAVPPAPVAGATPTTGHGGKPPTPVVPSEGDEQAIQVGIAKLFEVSKSLADEAFSGFIGALCRLNGEMIGLPMTEGGTLLVEQQSGGELDKDRRRRASGISTIRTLRPGEKSFGIAKLGIVALLNINRLVHRAPEVGWDLVTSHLIVVAHYGVAPAIIRLQAAEVLDEILIAAPKLLATAGEDLQTRMQTQILAAHEAQAQAVNRSTAAGTTDIEIRRMALETLFKVLESNGHAFVTGWEKVFSILRSACPSAMGTATPRSPAHPSSPAPMDAIAESGSMLAPTSRPSDKTSKAAVLVRTSFPSLQLICSDFLSALTIDDLRTCITTLAEFGKQTEDVNVSLTAGGLLWNVSDHLQSRRKEGDNEVAHGELWMFLLHQLLDACQDPRQEVRDGAMSILFRSIIIYGGTLAKGTWDACMWDILFPLVDALTMSIRLAGGFGDLDGAPDPNRELAEKQWDDSKILALTSLAHVFEEYLSQKIIKTARFDDTWTTLIAQIKRAFVEDRPGVATASMKALETILSVTIEEADEPRARTAWEAAWTAWDDIGHSIASFAQPSIQANAKLLTQVNLEAYVKAVQPLYASGRVNFDLSRTRRLLAILKAVLTFSKSVDYRPDIDTLTPVQAAVLATVALIKMEDAGIASAILSDLAEYITLAYVAAFEATSTVAGRTVTQKVTYIALTKEAMPRCAELFQQFKADESIYQEGAVERLLAAYALPIKLKHDCPAPSKFGSDQLLWKTAATHFLSTVRECIVSAEALGAAVPEAAFEGIWRQLLEGFQGSLLAGGPADPNASLDERRVEENFDLACLVSLEHDVVPYLGRSRVPDDLVIKLAKTLQSASRLYSLDLAPDALGLSSSDAPDADTTSDAPDIEARFDTDYDRQARDPVSGTTAEIVEGPRERFGYWCLDMLFLISSKPDGEEDAEKRRVAALTAKYLLNRCIATLKTYIADARLRGRKPFPRIRQEELVFILDKMLKMRLHNGALWASHQKVPSEAIKTAAKGEATRVALNAVHSQPKEAFRQLLLQSPVAHLYELQPYLLSLLSLSLNSHSGVPPGFNAMRRTDTSTSSLTLNEESEYEGIIPGMEPGKIGRDVDKEGNVVELALACLKVLGEELGVQQPF